MAKKSRLVEWLETETGKPLVAEGSGNDRHVSVRLPSDLHARVEAVGQSRGETVSQSIRRMVTESLERIERPDEAAIDVAIAALHDLKRRSA